MMDYRNNYNNENETNNENMMAAEQNSFNGKKPSSKNKKAAKLAKKIGAIALSAVLFGGVAGGTFQPEARQPLQQQPLHSRRLPTAAS